MKSPFLLVCHSDAVLLVVAELRFLLGKSIKNKMLQFVLSILCTALTSTQNEFICCFRYARSTPNTFLMQLFLFFSSSTSFPNVCVCVPLSRNNNFVQLKIQTILFMRMRMTTTTALCCAICFVACIRHRTKANIRSTRTHGTHNLIREIISCKCMHVNIRSVLHSIRRLCLQNMHKIPKYFLVSHEMPGRKEE